MSKINKIKSTACIGSGLIGSSWATLFAKEGYPVKIYDLDKENLAASKDKIEENFQLYIENGIMNQEAVKETMERISYTVNMKKVLENVDLVQECGFDKLDVKRSIVEEIDKYNPKALFCSSTSTLRISDIAQGSKYPERCMGAHPYNPPHLMPLVEITKCEETKEENIKIAYEFYKKLKKEPVILLKEAVGFIGNRLQLAYVREAIDIVNKGICSVEDLDKVSVYGLGIRWAILGPNLNGELNGGDGGVKSYFGSKYIAGMNKVLEEIADWKEIPEDYGEKVAAPGVKAEKNNRRETTGRTNEDIKTYRDRLLIGVLKLHEKL